LVPVGWSALPGVGSHYLGKAVPGTLVRDRFPNHWEDVARASLKEVVNAVLALACAVGLSGCGTVVNLATFKPEVCGGLVKDAAFFDRLRFPNGTPPSASGEKGRIGLLAFCVAEMSCSAVGDTLTLPLVLLWRAATIPREDGPSPAAGAVDRPGQYSAGSVAIP